MFKVAQCEFCGDYYKVGKLKKVVVTERGYDFKEIGESKEKTIGRKTVACITCYSKLNDNKPVTKKESTSLAFGSAI